MDWVFKQSQIKNKTPNHILRFIKEILSPKRFVGNSDVFEDHRQNLNQALILAGLSFEKDGELKKCDKASTLDEAERRVKIIRGKFQGRPIHQEVFKYCRTELVQDNYFHAVFEATKGLMQRIRDLSGITEDGAKLIDKVFSVEKPIIAFNALQTETERSEHIGFATLLKGCFLAIRNPSAHQPKLLWNGEDDAADYLTLISLLHRKLDASFLTRLQ